MSSSQHVLSLLRERYPKDSHALITEVGNATGYATNRHADAIAMSLWPSRGLEIMGFEVKVSRSDWVSELKNPAKADAIALYCDTWWLVVSDAKIVQPGELPLNGPVGRGEGKAQVHHRSDLERGSAV